MEFKRPPETNDRIILFNFDNNIEIPDDIEFLPYQEHIRKGVEIAVLFSEVDDKPDGADLAFLRYKPGAYVPGHVHIGYESVLVLQGDYIENGQTFIPGSFILRSPGTCHSMASNNGCLILASRYQPVKQLIDTV